MNSKNTKLNLNFKYGATLMLVVIFFQNCSPNELASTDQRNRNSLTLGSSAPIAAVPLSGSALPSVETNFGFVNVGTGQNPASLPISTIGPNPSTANNGASNLIPGSPPASSATPKVTARNGCGNSTQGTVSTVEYHLGSGECNTIVSNFIVAAESSQLTQAHLCLVKASQPQTSRFSAPEKCLFTFPMRSIGGGKFVWYSDNFFAFEGITFEDFRAEVYSDSEMRNQIGQVQVGLRFPILSQGSFFDLPSLDNRPDYAWTSSAGPLTYFMGCGGMDSVSASQAGWTRYAHPARNSLGQEFSDCYFRIGWRDNASPLMRSCEFPGGKIDGFACQFEPARADHMRSATSKSLAGGVGSVQATCSDSRWTNVVVTCAPAPKKPCSFTGYLAGYSAQFQSLTAEHGQTKTAMALTGGTGSVSARCDDEKWVDIVVNFTPRRACSFPGGAIDGCRGTFGAVGAFHNARQTTYSDTSGHSVSAVCNDGEWTQMLKSCD